MTVPSADETGSRSQSPPEPSRVGPNPDLPHSHLQDDDNDNQGPVESPRASPPHSLHIPGHASEVSPGSTDHPKSPMRSPETKSPTLAANSNPTAPVTTLPTATECPSLPTPAASSSGPLPSTRSEATLPMGGTLHPDIPFYLPNLLPHQTEPLFPPMGRTVISLGDGLYHDSSHNSTATTMTTTNNSSNSNSNNNHKSGDRHVSTATTTDLLYQPTLIPPANFAMVAPFVYRSSFPLKKHFPFLLKLGLKSILTLILEDYPIQNVKFLDEHGIQLYQFGVAGNKEPFVDIPQDTICAALAVLLDRRNHPILIHCNKGKHRTGCLVGCLRRLQHWSHTAIFNEYRVYSHPKSRHMDQQFIELFNINKVWPLVDRRYLPDWPTLL